eukprot:1157872-Pelagomonas_calceolata.AAC.11
MLHNALHKLLTRKLCFPARAGGEAMFDKADELKAQLERASVRVVTDYRDNYTPGWKYNYWELRGVPLRCEIGPKDMENGNVVLRVLPTAGTA